MPRTRHQRLREHGQLDRADLLAVLRAGFIAHLGVQAAHGIVDGLVLASSSFEHAVNYRSTMIYARPPRLTLASRCSLRLAARRKCRT
jgi:uncharacterized protein